MRLRRLSVQVRDPEHYLFGKDWVLVWGTDAASLISELFPKGASARVVDGLYAEVYCVRQGRRWRYYAGQPEPMVDEVRVTWGR